MMTSTRDERKKLAREPRSETDENCLPLQAADLIAWHLHKDYVAAQRGREHKDTAWDALKKLNTYPPMMLDENDLRRMARWDYLQEVFDVKKPAK